LDRKSSRLWVADDHRLNLCSSANHFLDIEKADDRAKAFECGGGVEQVRIADLDATRANSVTMGWQSLIDPPKRYDPRITLAKCKPRMG
jgi:hypothetical protein